MDYNQLSIITDEERKTRDIMKTHFATLRERATTDGTFDTMTDAETLGAILSLVRGGSFDPLTTAENLLDTFGSLKGVMEARAEQIARVQGMSSGRVEMIRMIMPLVRLWNRCANLVPDRIGNSREAENYCLSLLSGFRNERFYVIALNAQCKVVGRRCISEGSLSEVSAYPRMVVETALNFNAHSVLLCHNHPGGTCAPSPEDISSTIQLQRLLNGIGILIVDHIIVSNDRTYSMIQHGDIDYRVKR